MKTHLSNNYIITNSKGELYRFYPSETKGIVYDIYINNYLVNTSAVMEEGVIDFSVDIDKYDKVHLICLTKEGNLNYHIRKDEKWLSNKLTTLQLKSNKYNNLTLKITNDNIHVFYQQSDIINKSIWTIKHITFNKNQVKKYNVISFNPGKTLSPFYVDFDTLGNIHLIYKCKSNGFHHIYYTSYSSFLKRWIPTPQKISEEDTDNIHPYILVDTKNSVHVLWCSQVNSHYNINHKHLPYIQSNTYKWKYSFLPSIHGNILNPIMYEYNGALRLMYVNSGKLQILFSKDYGYNWKMFKDYKNIEIRDLIVNKYTSNRYNRNFYIKVNQVYCNFENDNKINIYPYELLQYDKDHFEQKKLHDNTKLDMDSSTIKDEQFNQEDIKHKISQDNQEINNNFSLDFEDIKNLDIKNYIKDLEFELESILIKSKELQNNKNEIERLLYKNTKKLDTKLIKKESHIQEVMYKLDTLREIIQQYEDDSERIMELLSLIKNKYEQNTIELKKIHKQVNETKELLEKLPKSTIWKKIFEIFKLDN